MKRTYYNIVKKKFTLKDGFWAWIGAFIAIGIIMFIDEYVLGLTSGSVSMNLASFGASAVLAYGAVNSPLAQPRNIIGGHMVSAIIGVTAYKALGGFSIEFAAAAAVATAIFIMLMTDTLHPPGGATALFAVTGGENIHRLGYVYVAAPVLIGAVIIVLVALIVNNLSRHENRKYPRRIE